MFRSKSRKRRGGKLFFWEFLHVPGSKSLCAVLWLDLYIPYAGYYLCEEAAAQVIRVSILFFLDECLRLLHCCWQETGGMDMGSSTEIMPAMYFFQEAAVKSTDYHVLGYLDVQPAFDTATEFGLEYSLIIRGSPLRQPIEFQVSGSASERLRSRQYPAGDVSLVLWAGRRS